MRKAAESVILRLFRFPRNGDNRTRTCDPLHVKQMLSQLSYVSSTLYFTMIFGIVNRRMINCLTNLAYTCSIVI